MSASRRSFLTALAVVSLFAPWARAEAQRAPAAAGPGTIVGVLLDPDRRPIEDAEVRIGRLDRATRTGRDGRFRFDSVPAGKYELRARRIGYAAQSRTVTLDEKGSVVSFTLKAVPQRLAPVVTSTSRGGLFGIVTDSARRPVAGAAVAALGAASRTSTDSAGEFFMGVRPGTFMVRVVRPGFAPRLVSVTVPKDSGRQIVIALVPGKPAPARDEWEMDNLRRRLVWRTSPAAIFGREKLDQLPNKRLLPLIRSVNPNPVREDDCLAILDGGPETVPLWYLDADELDAIEIYPRGTLSYLTGNRRESSLVFGRDAKIGDPVEDYLRAGAARTCPLIYVWLR